MILSSLLRVKLKKVKNLPMITDKMARKEILACLAADFLATLSLSGA